MKTNHKASPCPQFIKAMLPSVPGPLRAVDLLNEPRSSSAILCGRGDGRDRLYELFAEHWRRKLPVLSEEDLCSGFERYSWQAMLFTYRWFGNLGRISGRTSIVMMRFGMFVGWYGAQRNNLVKRSTA